MPSSLTASTPVVPSACTSPERFRPACCSARRFQSGSAQCGASLLSRAADHAVRNLQMQRNLPLFPPASAPRPPPPPPPWKAARLAIQLRQALDLQLQHIADERLQALTCTSMISSISDTIWGLAAISGSCRVSMQPRIAVSGVFSSCVALDTNSRAHLLQFAQLRPVADDQRRADLFPPPVRMGAPDRQHALARPFVALRRILPPCPPPARTGVCPRALHQLLPTFFPAQVQQPHRLRVALRHHARFVHGDHARRNGVQHGLQLRRCIRSVDSDRLSAAAMALKSLASMPISAG